MRVEHGQAGATPCQLFLRVSTRVSRAPTQPASATGRLPASHSWRAKAAAAAADAEPGRADYQRDLCVSLAKCAQVQGAKGAALAAAAAALARQLWDAGRLPVADASWVGALDTLVETLKNN